MIMPDDSLILLRERYPRVSDILGRQTAREMYEIPLSNLIVAAERGTAVHNYCTAYLEGLFLPQIEPEYQPYVNAFMEWARNRVRRVILTKKRFYDDQLKFSGEPDAVVILSDSDEVTLLDFKTTWVKSQSWPIQLAAYRHLLNLQGFNVERTMNIHLKKSVKTKTEKIQGEKVRVSFPVIDAKEVLPQIDFNESWRIFSSALICNKYFSGGKDELS